MWRRYDLRVRSLADKAKYHLQFITLLPLLGSKK
jgi:hypothetical protein